METPQKHVALYNVCLINDMTPKDIIEFYTDLRDCMLRSNSIDVYKIANISEFIGYAKTKT